MSDGAASVTAKKGAMPLRDGFCCYSCFHRVNYAESYVDRGVAGCKQKQNTVTSVTVALAKVTKSINSFCFWFLPGTKGRQRACARAKKPASI